MSSQQWDLVYALWQEIPKLVYAFWTLQPVKGLLFREATIPLTDILVTWNQISLEYGASVKKETLFEPTCAHAWWALRLRLLSVRLSVHDKC